MQKGSKARGSSSAYASGRRSISNKLLASARLTPEEEDQGCSSDLRHGEGHFLGSLELGSSPLRIEEEDGDGTCWWRSTGDAWLQRKQGWHADAGAPGGARSVGRLRHLAAR